jgi:hypothetical protein
VTKMVTEEGGRQHNTNACAPGPAKGEAPWLARVATEKRKDKTRSVVRGRLQQASLHSEGGQSQVCLRHSRVLLVCC